MRAVEDARVACEEHRWGDARRLLAEAPAAELDVEDLDRLATAAYLTGHDEDGFAHWVRAYRLCVDDSALHRAAHFGVKLAQGYGFKGDLGRCRGWVARVARLLEVAGIDCVEQGYLEYGLGMLAVFETGDLAGARAHFVAAGKIGSRFAHQELITLARIGEGRMLIYLGDLREGVTLLDEAMVSIESGELSVIATGDAYCTVIDACAELFDLDRSQAWTESFTQWCDTQQELVIYRGHCFLHRAEILSLLGSWSEALSEARHACDRLADPVMPTVLGAACALEGDLLCLLDDFTGAEAAYHRARDFGHDPEPGIALLRLAQGHHESANAMIRRALNETPDPLSRARLLGPYVEIALTAGDIVAARTATDELRTIADEINSPLLRAHAARAAGAVLLAEQNPDAALVQLRQAFNEFNARGVRYHAARTRLLIANACDALGDHDTAAFETTTARTALETLTARSSSTTEPNQLTPREHEVLRLLAEGKTNRTIAQDLIVSEKTVASHVSHIFTKLGVTTRSAATAYAYDHNLV